MTKLISNLSQGAKRAAFGALAAAVMTGSAMAATCEQVPGWITTITAHSGYKCGTGNATDECDLLISLPACCEGDLSPTEPNACLCDSANLTNPLYNLNPAGIDVATECP